MEKNELMMRRAEVEDAISELDRLVAEAEDAYERLVLASDECEYDE